MRMKAAVAYGVNQPLVVEEVELDPPHAGEVMVKLHATGVCHSDVHSITGDLPRDWPVILGHEGAGEIVEVGEGVKGQPLKYLLCGRVHFSDEAPHLFRLVPWWKAEVAGTE